MNVLSYGHLPRRFVDERRAVRIVRRDGEAQDRVFIGDEKVSYAGADPCDATGRAEELAPKLARTRSS